MNKISFILDETPFVAEEGNYMEFFLAFAKELLAPPEERNIAKIEALYRSDRNSFVSEEEDHFEYFLAVTKELSLPPEEQDFAKLESLFKVD